MIRSGSPTIQLAPEFLFLTPLLPALLVITHFLTSLLGWKSFELTRMRDSRVVLAPAICYCRAQANGNKVFRLKRIEVILGSLALSCVIAIPIEIDWAIRGVSTNAHYLNTTVWLTARVLIVYQFCVWLVVGVLMRLVESRKQKRLVQFGWVSQPSITIPKAFESDEEKIVIVDANCSLRFRWPALTRFVETEFLFLLYESDYSFHIIPKRAFNDDNAMLFPGLLSRNIANGFVIERRNQGFPVRLVTTNPTGPA